MRRIFVKCISNILVCLMFFGICCQFRCDAVEAGMNDSVKKAVDILRYFEFIPDYYDYNTDVTELATRADFVSAGAKLAGASNYGGDGIYYYDVSNTHWAYNEINELTERGVLNGSGDKLFKPDDKILKTEAYKIILSLMGYKQYAETSGGYPNGYIIFANKTGIAKGISGEEYVTLGDMFIMLYNAMRCEVADTTSFVGENAKYTVLEGETLMSLYHNIYHDIGIVTGVDFITLDGGSLSSKDEVKIDGDIYKSDILLTDKLGEEIEYFYSDNTNVEEKRVVWCTPTGKTDYLEITVDNDASFNKTTFELEYSDGNKKRSISLERGVTLIYNGGIVSENIDKIFGKPRYNAKFIKDSGKGYYIAIVKAYENIIADKIDAENLVIYDKVNPNKKIVLDEKVYENMSVKMLGKTEISFSDIQRGNVLSIYLSENKKFLEVHVSGEQITGALTEISNVDNGKELVIDGISYFMPKEASDNGISPGDNVRIYMDIKGEVVYAEVSDTNGFAAYIIKTVLGDSTESGFEKTVHIKMFTQKGEVVYAETASNVIIDGVKYKNVEDAYVTLSGTPLFALIETDKSGKIKVIDTPNFNPESESEDSLTVSVPWAEGIRYKSIGVLGTQSVVNSNTKIFAVPSDANLDNADDIDFTILTSSQITNDTMLDAETYRTKKRIGYEEFVLLKGYTKYNDTSEMPVLVTHISSTMNYNGETVDCINGYQGANKVSINAESGVSFFNKGIKNGMFISVKKNNIGEATDCKILYDYREKEKYPSDTDINGAYTVVNGYVTDIVDDVVKIGINAKGNYDRIMYTSGVPVLVFDSKLKTDNNIRIGTINDAATYYNVDDECSAVVLFTMWMTPYVYVVYK